MATDRLMLHVCTARLTARIFIAPLVRHLQAAGYSVAVVCAPAEATDGPGLSDDLDLVGCLLYVVAIPRTIRPLTDLRAVWQLCRLMRRLRPVIVHTQTAKAGLVGRLAAWLSGTPVIIHTAHAFPFHPYLPGPVRWAYIVLERWAATLADLILVDTESVRADGLRYHIVRDPAKLVVVPMGIDLKKFSPSSRGPRRLRHALGFVSHDLVIGTVARLVQDKGLECFLQMAARIRARRVEARFLIVGDGPLRRVLERLADSLGLRRDVVFTGHRTDVPALLDSMDLFVLPTLREGFGVVFAEAMAMGKAVIGSRIGPVAEVIKDGITGYLVSPDSPDEFARRALELLDDEAKRAAFGKAGRQRVETLYSEEMMCKAIVRQYQRVLKAKGLLA